MYLAPLKTLIVSALQETFNGSYPNADFRNVKVSIEYPINAQAFPSIWVDYDDSAPLQIAGVKQEEHRIGSDGAFGAFTRWRYSGYSTLTVVALSSFERDRLFDEVVRVVAFGTADTRVSTFRDLVESNDFIAVNINFDQIDVRGNAATPGTPWGTDEVVYERSINLDVWGEFISDPSGTLARLSAIPVFGEAEVFAPGDGAPYLLGGYEALDIDAAGSTPTPDNATGWI